MNDTFTAVGDALFLGAVCVFTVVLVSAVLRQWAERSYIDRLIDRSIPDPINPDTLAALPPEAVLALLQGPHARRRCACGRYGQPAEGSFTLIVIDDGELYRHTEEQCCPEREHISGPVEPCSCGRYLLAEGQLFLSWDPRHGCVRHRTVLCERAAVDDDGWDGEDDDWDDEEDF